MDESQQDLTYADLLESYSDLDDSDSDYPRSPTESLQKQVSFSTARLDLKGQSNSTVHEETTAYRDGQDDSEPDTPQSDDSYRPTERTGTSIRTTPSEREALARPLSDNGKARVRVVDPQNGRCAVEHCAEVRAVEFAHCVARHYTKDKKLMTNLEYAWGMKYMTLNLNTRYNILRLGAALHYLFDVKPSLWLLLPDDATIDRYFKALVPMKNPQDDSEVSQEDEFGQYKCERKSFPIVRKKNYQYRFIPIHPRIKSIAIVRQKSINAHDEPSSPDDFVVHIHPFDNLAPTTLHVHPRFVIFDAGHKMLSMKRTDVLPLFEKHPALRKVVSIYIAWTRDRDEEELKDTQFGFAKDLRKLKKIRVGKHPQVDVDVPPNGPKTDVGRIGRKRKHL